MTSKSLLKSDSDSNFALKSIWNLDSSLRLDFEVNMETRVIGVILTALKKKNKDPEISQKSDSKYQITSNVLEFDADLTSESILKFDFRIFLWIEFQLHFDSEANLETYNPDCDSTWTVEVAFL